MLLAFDSLVPSWRLDVNGKPLLVSRPCFHMRVEGTMTSRGCIEPWWDDISALNRDVERGTEVRSSNVRDRRNG
jgi:hypothetical protein